ncbi:hypothetical protein PR048_016688, partial [Dryococelus australis]
MKLKLFVLLSFRQKSKLRYSANLEHQFSFPSEANMEQLLELAVTFWRNNITEASKTKEGPAPATVAKVVVLHICDDVTLLHALVLKCQGHAHLLITEEIKSRNCRVENFHEKILAHCPEETLTEFIDSIMNYQRALGLNLLECDVVKILSENVALQVRAACSLTAVPRDMEELRNWAVEIGSYLVAEREFNVTVNSRKQNSALPRVMSGGAIVRPDLTLNTVQENSLPSNEVAHSVAMTIWNIYEGKVLQRFRDAGLTVNPDNKVAANKAGFLGYVICDGKSLLDPERVAPTENSPPFIEHDECDLLTDNHALIWVLSHPHQLGKLGRWVLRCGDFDLMSTMLGVRKIRCQAHYRVCTWCQQVKRDLASGIQCPYFEKDVLLYFSGKTGRARSLLSLACSTLRNFLPLVRSKRGNVCLLIVLDIFTKFVILLPLKNVKASSIARVLQEQVWKVFGVLAELVTDNQRYFQSHCFKDTCFKRAIKFYTSSPLVSTIFHNRDQTEWDPDLELINVGFNAAIHDSNGSSSSLHFLGRHLPHSLLIIWNLPLPSSLDSGSLDRLLVGVASHLNDSKREVVARLDKCRIDHLFSVGDKFCLVGCVVHALNACSCLCTPGFSTMYSPGRADSELVLFEKICIVNYIFCLDEANFRAKLVHFYSGQLNENTPLVFLLVGPLWTVFNSLNLASNKRAEMFAAEHQFSFPSEANMEQLLELAVTFWRNNITEASKTKEGPAPATVAKVVVLHICDDVTLLHALVLKCQGHAHLLITEEIKSRNCRVENFHEKILAHCPEETLTEFIDSIMNYQRALGLNLLECDVVKILSENVALQVRAACSLTAVPRDMEELRNWAVEIGSYLVAEREFNVTVNSRKQNSALPRVMSGGAIVRPDLTLNTVQENSLPSNEVAHSVAMTIWNIYEGKVLQRFRDAGLTVNPDNKVAANKAGFLGYVICDGKSLLDPERVAPTENSPPFIEHDECDLLTDNHALIWVLSHPHQLGKLGRWVLRCGDFDLMSTMLGVRKIRCQAHYRVCTWCQQVKRDLASGIQCPYFEKDVLLYFSGKTGRARSLLSLACSTLRNFLPLVRSKRGNVCLLIVLDIFTKFVILLPLKNVKASSIARVLQEQVWKVFGVLAELVTDNQRYFQSHCFKDTCFKRAIKFYTSSPLVSTIFHNRDQTEWDPDLELINVGFNAAIHDSNGSSSSLHFLGRHLPHSLLIIWNLPLPSSLDSGSLDRLLVGVASHLNDSKREVVARLDKCRIDHLFSVGDKFCLVGCVVHALNACSCLCTPGFSTMYSPGRADSELVLFEKICIVNYIFCLDEANFRAKLVHFYSGQLNENTPLVFLLVGPLWTVFNSLNLASNKRAEMFAAEHQFSFPSEANMEQLLELAVTFWRNNITEASKTKEGPAPATVAKVVVLHICDDVTLLHALVLKCQGHAHLLITEEIKSRNCRVENFHEKILAHCPEETLTEFIDSIMNYQRALGLNLLECDVVKILSENVALQVRAACSLTAVPRDMEELRNWAVEIGSYLVAEREFNVTVNSRKQNSALPRVMSGGAIVRPDLTLNTVQENSLPSNEVAHSVAMTIWNIYEGKVLQRFRDAGLTVNPDNKVAANKAGFLGYVICDGKSLLDPERVAPTENSPPFIEHDECDLLTDNHALIWVLSHPHQLGKLGRWVLRCGDFDLMSTMLGVRKIRCQAHYRVCTWCQQVKRDLASGIQCPYFEKDVLLYFSGKTGRARSLLSLACSTLRNFLPLVRSKRGNVCLLIVLDIFTKFVILLPLKNVKASSIARVLQEQVWKVFGVLAELVTDNQRYFQSHCFKDTCFKRAIKFYTSSPLVSTIFHNRDQTEWDPDLELINVGFNAAIHDSNGSSSSLHFLGRHLPHSLLIIWNLPLPSSLDSGSLDRLLVGVASHLNDSKREVVARLDKCRIDHLFSVGDKFCLVGCVVHALNACSCLCTPGFSTMYSPGRADSELVLFEKICIVNYIFCLDEANFRAKLVHFYSGQLNENTPLVFLLVGPLWTVFNSLNLASNKRAEMFAAEHQFSFPSEANMEQLLELAVTFWRNNITEASKTKEGPAPATVAKVVVLHICDDVTLLHALVLKCQGHAHLLITEEIKSRNCRVENFHEKILAHCPEETLTEFIDSIMNYQRALGLNLLECDVVKILSENVALQVRAACSLTAVPRDMEELRNWAVEIGSYLVAEREFNVTVNSRKQNSALPRVMSGGAIVRPDLTLNTVQENSLPSNEVAHSVAMTIWNIYEGKVLQRFRDAGLTVNPDNKVAANKAGFLGYVICDGKSLLDPERVAPTENSPPFIEHDECDLLTDNHALIWVLSHPHQLGKLGRWVLRCGDFDLMSTMLGVRKIRCQAHYRVCTWCQQVKRDLASGIQCPYFEKDVLLYFSGKTGRARSLLSLACSTLRNFLPLVRSKRGNVCLLIVLDIFTKFVILLPLKNVKASSIARVLQEQVWKVFGVLAELVTDNQRYFQSHCFKDTCFKRAIKFYTSSPLVSTIFHNRDQTEWDPDLELINVGFNAAIHDSNGSSSSLHFLGRHLPHSLLIIWNLPLPSSLDSGSLDRLLVGVASHLNDSKREVVARLDKCRIDHLFSVGDKFCLVGCVVHALNACSCLCTPGFSTMYSPGRADSELVLFEKICIVNYIFCLDEANFRAKLVHFYSGQLNENTPLVFLLVGPLWTVFNSLNLASNKRAEMFAAEHQFSFPSEANMEQLLELAVTFWRNNITEASKTKEGPAPATVAKVVVLHICDDVTLLHALVLKCQGHAHLLITEEIKSRNCRVENFHEKILAHCPEETLTEFIDSIMNYQRALGLNLLECDVVKILSENVALQVRAACSLTAVPRDMEELRNWAVEIGSYLVAEREFNVTVNSRKQNSALPRVMSGGAIVRPDLTLNTVQENSLPSNEVAHSVAMTIWNIYEGKVLQRFRDAGLTVNPDNKVAANKAGFLGYVICDGKSLLDPERVAPTENSPPFIEHDECDLLTDNHALIWVLSHPHQLGKLGRWVLRCGDFDLMSTMLGVRKIRCQAHYRVCTWCQQVKRDLASGIQCPYFEKDVLLYFSGKTGRARSLLSLACSTLRNFLPLVRSKRGNVCLLIVLDIFTKFVILLPLKNVKASSIARVLQEQVWKVFGVLAELVTDNQRYFQSHCFKDTCFKRAIKFYTSSPLVSTIFHNRDQTEWDPDLELINVGFNAAIHDSNGSSSSLHFLGRHLPHSLLIIWNLPLPSSLDSGSLDRLLVGVASHLNDSKREVVARLDKCRIDHLFSVGDKFCLVGCVVHALNACSCLCTPGFSTMYSPGRADSELVLFEKICIVNYIFCLDEANFRAKLVHFYSGQLNENTPLVFLLVGPLWTVFNSLNLASNKRAEMFAAVHDISHDEEGSPGLSKSDCVTVATEAGKFTPINLVVWKCPSLFAHPKLAVCAIKQLLPIRCASSVRSELLSCYIPLLLRRRCNFQSRLTSIEQACNSGQIVNEITQCQPNCLASSDTTSSVRARQQGHLEASELVENKKRYLAANIPPPHAPNLLLSCSFQKRAAGQGRRLVKDIWDTQE